MTVERKSVSDENVGQNNPNEIETEKPEPGSSKSEKPVDNSAEVALLKAQMESVIKLLGDKGISQAEIDKVRKQAENDSPTKEDLLPEPIVLYTNSVGFFISDYEINGVPYLIPFKKPLKFRLLQRYEVVGADGKKYKVSLSYVVVWSRSILEWIRKYPNYNITIFEKYEIVKNTDVRLSRKKAEINRGINMLSPWQLKAEARAAGININQPEEQIREELLTKRAKAMLDAERKVQETVVIQAHAIKEEMTKT
jgi:hypothetical protein